MTDATTPNYGWSYPTVNADADTWGTTLNATVVAIDGQVKTNADAAAAAVAGLMPINDATATGVFTGPDGGVWNSGGIGNITALGIGAGPSFPLDIFGGTAQMRLRSSGTAVLFRITNSTGEFGHIGDAHDVIGSGFSTADMAISSASNMIVGCASTFSTVFTNAASEHGRFAPDGSFLVGSASNAGAGCIAATGYITAFYSDDRLKTRLGGIEDPLGKVMALKGFYYEENDRAVELGYVRKRKVGISAQDLKRVLPEAVARAPISDKGRAEDGSDYLTTYPDQIIPLLIEAVKALNAKIDAK